jgi:Holliday junction resolvase RusA-like endonuclease
VREFEFTVPGTPIGKGRPRYTGYGRPYTPQKTRDKEKEIALAYKSKYGGERFSDLDQLRILIHAYFPIPVSATKKFHTMAVNGELYPTKKPDWDNIGKLVCDALNGVAYRDDSQIVMAMVIKHYSDNPRLEIDISEVP